MNVGEPASGPNCKPAQTYCAYLDICVCRGLLLDAFSNDSMPRMPFDARWVIITLL